MIRTAPFLHAPSLVAAASFLALACAGSRAPGGAGERPSGSKVRVTLLPSESSPLVAIRLLCHVGSIHDPAGKEGLAALTAAMLSEGGTKRLPYADLLDSLYPLAASIGTRADKEVTVIAGTVHRDNLTRYYDLLRQVFLEPRFAEKDFERIKADQLNYLTNILRATDDENLGKEALGSVMYEGHPYGRPVEGTVGGIQAVTLGDVRKFFSGHFTRDNCEVGLSGGYPDSFVERVRRDIASLPTGRPKPMELPEPRFPQGLETTVVTKSARAWAISIGYPIGVTRADEDFYALLVANSYLGEHRTFNGVLMNRMRGDRGLNYGDYSYIENFIQDGFSTFPLANTPRRQQFFSIWIRPVAPENAHFAIRQALRELQRLVRDGMSRQDFEDTRDFLLNYSRLWTQTSSRRLGYAMDGNFYGRESLVDEIQKRLPGLTVEHVNRSIRRYLQADNAYVAVVADEGGAPGFVEALRDNRPSPITYATETKPEVLREDEEIAVYPLKVNRDRVRLIPADSMFER